MEQYQNVLFTRPQGGIIVGGRGGGIYRKVNKSAHWNKSAGCKFIAKLEYKKTIYASKT